MQDKKNTVQRVHRGLNNVPDGLCQSAGALREGNPTPDTALMQIRMVLLVLLTIIKCASFP